MQSAIARIQAVLDANILDKEQIYVPESGASAVDIETEEKLLYRPLSALHRALLQQWNGLDLVEVAFCVCGKDHRYIERISTLSDQIAELADLNIAVDAPIAIAVDGNELVYVELNDGEIYSIDRFESTAEKVATDLADLITRVFFGSDAARWNGDAWLSDLKVAGILGQPLREAELSRKDFTMTAQLDKDGWTRCPKCNFKFHWQSESAFHRGKHKRCGQRLELLPEK